MSKKSRVEAALEKEPVLQVNFLDPERMHFERMEYGGLLLRLDGEVYEHLRVYRVFPLSQPDEYIAIRTGDSELEQEEIGQIRYLDELAPEDRALIDEELEKRYFIHTVEKILSIREDMGYFYWDVETDKGIREFPVPISTKYVVPIGAGGRLISDLDGNRYHIPNLDALDSHSRATFRRYIYW